MARSTIIMKPTLADRRKAAVSAVMELPTIKSYISELRVADRANMRNWIREFVGDGYDAAMRETKEVLALLGRTL